MPALCALISETVWNCLIVFEDAHKHQYNRIDRSVMRLMGDSKQKNVDIIFMYHNFGLAPKDLYRYLDYIEIFKMKLHQPSYPDHAFEISEIITDNSTNNATNSV